MIKRMTSAVHLQRQTVTWLFGGGGGGGVAFELPHLLRSSNMCRRSGNLCNDPLAHTHPQCT